MKRSVGYLLYLGTRTLQFILVYQMMEPKRWSWWCQQVIVLDQRHNNAVPQQYPASRPFVRSFDRSFVVNTFIQFRVLRCGSIFIVPCCGAKGIKSNEIGLRKLSGFVFYCISFQFSLIQTVVVDDIIKNDSCFGRFRTYQFCT